MSQASANEPGSAASPRSTAAGPASSSFWDRFFYGLGSIAFGVKDNGFAILLMLFYNQALGVPAASVGFAIMIALLIDAVADPLIGNWSDNTRTRLGRRHPFMYAAALPVAVSYYFLWNPPHGLTPSEVFWYLLVLSVIIRIFISFYEIPSSALIADLSRDYNERTTFLSYRYFFGWVGGLTMGVSAFSIFLRPGPNDPSGQLNLQGYSNYGLTASLIMFTAIIISSLGTQRRVKSFTPPPPKLHFNFARSSAEVIGTLWNRPFLILLAATFVSYAAAGIGGSILTYFRVYFWELTGDQISFLMVGNFASVAVALYFAPRFAARIGKKRAAIILGLVYAVIVPLPAYLRVLGLMPANGTDALYVVLFGASFVGATLAMSTGILGSSMLADVVEYSAVRTGRHAAGLLFSANAFVLKATSGVGIFGTGLILDYIAFPANAKQGQVPADVLHHLGTLEPTVILFLSLAATSLIFWFPITKTVHEENLRRLNEQEKVFNPATVA